MTAAQDLSDLQRDALKEIGNIGAGHAATALSQLLNTRIALVEPRIEVVRFGDLAERARRGDREVAALHMNVRGGAPGQILVVFDREPAIEFVSRFIRRVIGDITIYDSIAESTLKELGNIVAGSYLSAIVQLTGVRMEPSVPTLEFGPADRAFDAVVCASPDRQVFLIESVFLDRGASIGGEFVLIPDTGSLDPLLSVFAAA
jgi:chemotaxis protein CheC